jgi:hypothetical protein
VTARKTKNGVPIALYHAIEKCEAPVTSFNGMNSAFISDFGTNMMPDMSSFVLVGILFVEFIL